MADVGGIAEQSWPSQVRELEYRLSRSKARWKIVVGHHPVRNNRMAPIPSLMQVSQREGNHEMLKSYLSNGKADAKVLQNSKVQVSKLERSMWQSVFAGGSHVEIHEPPLKALSLLPCNALAQHTLGSYVLAAMVTHRPTLA